MKNKTTIQRRLHRMISRALTLAPALDKVALSEALLARSILKAKEHKNRLARITAKIKRRAC
ncbi:hypothetical protein CHOCRA_000177 [Candidatus Hodgkinia cicadicola]|nr:hypothetical protein CHOCRA_000177 [Candidatus Hodgkinia cicadicola]